MKKLLIAILALLSLTASAQENAWEDKAQAATAQNNPDAKYMAGAVPEVDGKVVFTKVIKAPGKTAQQLYDALLKQMEYLTTDQNQVQPYQSRMVIADAEKKQLIGSYQEWLVFKNTALVLDRTRFLYHLIGECSDGEVKLSLTRIVYIYEEERDPQTIVAEDWITDKQGLNKKQTKLARVSGKFRRKTIDRKDFIFEKLNQSLTK